MADLHTITTETGDVHVGFDADGTFIPIGHVTAARIKQLQERAGNLRELAESDDPDAVRRHDEAAAGLPYSVPGTGKGKKGESTKGGES